MSSIVVEDLWLKFKIHFHHEDMTVRRLLIEALQNIVRSGFSLRSLAGGSWSDFWALQGISFEVAKGEVLGIIGPNGAGKSTLLQVLSGIYAPNRGRVETTGRIGTLLSLGAGFHNELTGRENIILNGICMGFSRKEITEKVKQIMQFAELGEFIDAPIKTYSKGMRARLGFSVAVNIDPDILLIDEVLQAGDLAFRKRAGNILQKFQDLNKTVVVVTHDMGLVKRSCNRAILLHEGKILADGEPKEIVRAYTELQEEQPEAAPKAKPDVSVEAT